MRSFFNILSNWLEGTPLCYNHTGRIALCCIVKLENLYIREYVDYYKKLGVDTIFLYDNNDCDGEHVEEAISDYITQGIVRVINYRGRIKCQIDAYVDCYNKNKKDFDWFCFFDADEFLTIREPFSLKEFLANHKFLFYQIIHLNWMCFGDNELLYYEDKNVVDRFKEPLPIDIKRNGILLNSHIKSIVRGNLKYLDTWYTPHTPHAKYRSCDCLGKKCDTMQFFNTINYEKAYIRHYITKTIEEWVMVKQRRGYPDQDYLSAKRKLNLEVFFELNKKTHEKETIVISLLPKPRV